MKKTNLVIFAVLFSLLIFPKAWATSLYFDPANSTINIGESIDLNIMISGLSNEDLHTFDFNVNYDNSILDFAGYSLQDGLGSLDLFDAMDLSFGDLGNGSIHLSEFSSLFDLSFQEDSFALATLSFTAKSAGKALLSFAAPDGYTEVILGNELWGNIDADLGDAYMSVLEKASPVPEPATISLFGIGLLGFAVFRRRCAH